MFAQVGGPAVPAVEWMWLIPAVPLVAAGINLFAGRRLGKGAGWLGSAAVASSFLLAVWAVVELMGARED